MCAPQRSPVEGVRADLDEDAAEDRLGDVLDQVLQQQQLAMEESRPRPPTESFDCRGGSRGFLSYENEVKNEKKKKEKN